MFKKLALFTGVTLCVASLALAQQIPMGGQKPATQKTPTVVKQQPKQTIRTPAQSTGIGGVSSSGAVQSKVEEDDEYGVRTYDRQGPRGKETVTELRNQDGTTLRTIARQSEYGEVCTRVENTSEPWDKKR